MTQATRSPRRPQAEADDANVSTATPLCGSRIVAIHGGEKVFSHCTVNGIGRTNRGFLRDRTLGSRERRQDELRADLDDYRLGRDADPEARESVVPRGAGAEGVRGGKRG